MPYKPGSKFPRSLGLLGCPKRYWRGLIFFLYSCIVPLGFLSREIRVAFPGESQLRQGRATQSTVHAGCFKCFHNPPNSGMDCMIFHVRTDVNACDCTRECMDTVRESALNVDSRREKSLDAPGNRTCVSGVPVQSSTDQTPFAPSRGIGERDRNSASLRYTITPTMILQRDGQRCHPFYCLTSVAGEVTSKPQAVLKLPA